MLLQFSVNNFKSIKDTATISMNSSIKAERNTFDLRNYKINTSAVLYGHNATGKSNFLKALGFMSATVLNKTKVTQSTDVLEHHPFKLSTETEKASSSFEIVFFVNEIKYRYGYEMDNIQVYSEWLFEDTKGKEAKLFFRDVDEGIFYINKNKFKEGVGLKVLKNHLFIWKTDQEGGEVSASILNWFSHLNFIDGSEKGGYVEFASNQLDNKDFKQKIASLIKKADLGIESINKEEVVLNQESIDNLKIPDVLKEKLLSDNNKIKLIKLKTEHKKYNSDLTSSELVEFELKEESIGTQQFFYILAPVLDTLEKGKVLLIDEFGASLHPNLSKSIVKMFNNKEINKFNAQLLFVTHDTNMLDNTLFRKDQIWFTEKDYYGATKLFSLADYKNIRKTENFEKNYLQGKYGAIPYLSDFNFAASNHE